LSSYMLSVINNPITFSTIHTLNISRLSDSYVPMLNRKDFRDALPSLKKLVLKIIPSWHSFHGHNAGAETPEVNPADAADMFHALLQEVVSQLENVTHLTIGWATGGEHAEGIFARNPEYPTCTST
jgi:dienelactone hydrolase